MSCHFDLSSSNFTNVGPILLPSQSEHFFYLTSFCIQSLSKTPVHMSLSFNSFFLLCPFVDSGMLRAITFFLLLSNFLLFPLPLWFFVEFFPFSLRPLPLLYPLYFPLCSSLFLLTALLSVNSSYFSFSSCICCFIIAFSSFSLFTCAQPFTMPGLHSGPNHIWFSSSRSPYTGSSYASHNLYTSHRIALSFFYLTFPAVVSSSRGLGFPLPPLLTSVLVAVLYTCLPRWVTRVTSLIFLNPCKGSTFTASLFLLYLSFLLDHS